MRNILSAALLSLLFISPAIADENPNCLSREEMVKTLNKDFGENQVVVGISLDGTLMEIFSRPDGSTFTVILTDPRSNQSCIVNIGFAISFSKDNGSI